MRNKTPKDKFPITDLSLYFDTVAKDRLDSGSVGSRNSEILGLRDLMLRLSDQEFAVLMRSFRASSKNVLETRESSSDKGSQIPPEQAANLYDGVQGSSPSGSDKIDQVA